MDDGVDCPARPAVIGKRTCGPKERKSTIRKDAHVHLISADRLLQLAIEDIARMDLFPWFVAASIEQDEVRSMHL